MRTGTKMLVLTSERNNNGRMEMGGGYGQMEMNNMEARRRRDSRGRFRSEMEGYGEMNGGSMEMQSGYGRSAMEAENGGYSNYGNNARMGGYPRSPFPVYEGGGQMNRIGFNAGGHEVQTNYRMNATHQTGNEMEYRPSAKMGGAGSSTVTMPMSRNLAEEWIHNMKLADGTKGPRWEIEDVKKIMEKKTIRCDVNEFAAILNAVYSDYCAVMRKHGVESEDLYVDLAYAWLKDEDAMPDKAMLYYEYIVKK